MAGEVCANKGPSQELYVCCNPDKMQGCADIALHHEGDDPNLYCAPWGWQRLPMVKPGDPHFAEGRVCHENEICALRTGDCIRHVCCDPREDPKCGVPGATCT